MWVRQLEHLRVGQVLQSIREDAELTQVELAKRLRKPQSFISSYERGQRRLDVPEFLKIVTTIGADPEKVFSTIAKGKAPNSKK